MYSCASLDSANAFAAAKAKLSAATANRIIATTSISLPREHPRLTRQIPLSADTSLPQCVAGKKSAGHGVRRLAPVAEFVENARRSRGVEHHRAALANSQRLAALARSPVELIAVEGAGHNDIHRFPSYLDALAARLIAAGAPPLAKP